MRALILIGLFLNTFLFAQNYKNDSIKFNYKSFIIPSILLTYGIVGIHNPELKLINNEIKQEVLEHIDKKITIDDISQYTPILAVYGLDMLGISGKNNLKDRTIILGTAYLLMSSTVVGLKTIIDEERPDNSSKNSFPSGHTATAFMGAEFLYQEYKEKSILYGILGYVVATGTGLFRIYNDRHWLTDVAAGAGIGILSTKIAYLTHPWVKKKIFKDKKKSNTLILPFYNNKNIGLSFTITL